MSKILSAKCSGKVVRFNGIPVDAEIITEGVGSSDGVLFIQGGKVYYITSNSSDIKNLLTEVSKGLNKVAEMLTAIGGKMTGPSTAPPPELAQGVVEIQQVALSLDEIKEVLK